MSAGVPRVPGTVLDMIREEYDEMPDMRLTRVQFRRLWRLQDDVCAAAILELTANGFLGVDARGRIQRACDLAV